MHRSARLAAALLCLAPAAFAAQGGGPLADWHAGNEIGDRASLQRGAAHFANYCAGCHSLKYMRYQRLGEDLEIPAEALKASLIPADRKPTDYIITAMSPADGEAWFGIAPPDLSLITRSRGTDYVYRFLKAFYADPSKPTGVNNVVLAGTAMPHVLAGLQGVQEAVFDASGEHFEGFELAIPGELSPVEYDAFVRDTVNFLDYVGEPAQLVRTSVGIWVVLFLLAFTGIAWLLKQEYWKDVR